MDDHKQATEVTFSENSPIDSAALNALYRCIGWDSHERRTEAEPLNDEIRRWEPE